MKKILIITFCYLLITLPAFSWDETRYDTVEVKWPNGNLKEYYTRYWFTGNEKGFQPDGQYSSFYENGQLQEQGNYKWNIKNGIWLKWDESGNRIEETNYFDGRRTGTHIEWHPENSIKVFGYYKNDFKNGLWIYQRHNYDINNPDLIIDSIMYYQSDTVLVFLEGYQGKWLHDNPNYHNEHLDIWIEWKRQNAMDYLTNYKWFYVGKKIDGKKTGKWVKHAANGEVLEINYYKNGQVVKIEDLLK